MKLSFSEHLSAKTRRHFQLKVFPAGEPTAFLTRRQEEERGESLASICEYEFPDQSVVVACIEFGPAEMAPDAPVTVTVEVHIGPEARASVIAAAEAEAKKIAAQAGIEEYGDRIPGFSGLWVIRH